MLYAGLTGAAKPEELIINVVGCENSLRKSHASQKFFASATLESSANPEKTRIVSLEMAGKHFDFLGYRFWRTRRGNITRLIRPKSKQNLKQKLKPLTKRANGHSLEALVKKLNPILRGWYGYYKHARADVLKEMDGWIRGRLRAILRKRKGLRGRGRGCDHWQWPKQYFDTLGLFCLEAARRKEYSSLRNGVKC